MSDEGATDSLTRAYEAAYQESQRVGRGGALTPGSTMGEMELSKGKKVPVFRPGPAGAVKAFADIWASPGYARYAERRRAEAAVRDGKK